jgi:hypothetical protein
MSRDFLQSVYRERLLEHLLIGELLKHSWLHHGAELEVATPSVDRTGHDVVLEANGVVRHVQLKASSLKASTRSQGIHLHLARKPSGCVVWIKFDPTDIRLDHFLFFGEGPKEPLPAMDHFGVAKHTKGDATGLKKQRPNLRIVPATKFRQIESIAKLYETLFGAPAAEIAAQI